MKLAVMGVELANGKFGAVAAASVVGLIEQAKLIRNSGMFEGEAAKQGMVLSSERIAPVMQFRCSSVVKPLKKGK
jgi:hypothetical protein